MQEDGEFGFLDEFDDDETAGSTRDPRAWWMAGLAVATCLAAIAVAIVLLRLGGGGGKHNEDLGLPIVTGGPTSPALISPPVVSDTAIATTPVHPIRTLHTSVRPTRTATTTAARSTSAHPTPHLTTSSPRTTSAAPPPTTTAPPPPPPPSSSAPAPVVQLSKGGRDFRCNPHCYFMVVSIANLPGGHHVVCHSARAGAFASYDTTQAVSYDCSWDRPGDTVWVVVDGKYASNAVIW